MMTTLSVLAFFFVMMLVVLSVFLEVDIKFFLVN